MRKSLSNDDNLYEFGYYSMNSIIKKRFVNIAKISLLVFIWYSCAVVTITTSKEIMNRVNSPFLLSTIQFLFATIISFIYLLLFKPTFNLSYNLRVALSFISISYTLGFILTNSAFSIVPAAFAETIKSSEPISTVSIGYLFMKEEASLRTYATLIPICFGIGLSCYHNNAFNFLGFLLAASSNIFFSLRAVLTKRMNSQANETVDDITLFAFISFYGLFILIPIAFFFEKEKVLLLLSAPREILIDSSMGVFVSLLIINGVTFACYNLMSYFVLRQTDLITHSVLNAFRRVFIIIATTLYFHSSLSYSNALGVFIAIIGVVLFGYFKATDLKIK